MSECIVSISTRDSFKIHCLAFIFGLWILIQRLARWAWNPNAFFRQEIRDNPPACLVDSSLGHHSYVKLKGIKLHYLESGNKGNPLVLLLHGFPDCWLSWRHQIAPLSHYFHVVALDLKGFGDSDKPPWRRSYRIDTILNELKQFIAAFGVSDCTIVGHDLGALLGWYLVQSSPELVRKFVAVSCPHPNIYWSHLNNKSKFNTTWLNVIQLPYLPEIDALKEDVNIINECYQHLKHQKNNKDPYVEAYKYTFSRTEDWTGPLNYYRNLPFIRIIDDGLISVPSLLITGNQDQCITLEGVVKSADFCDKYLVKIIEGTAHFPHQENPFVFNKILLDFLVVKNSNSKTFEKCPPPSKGIMNRMLGAVTNTVQYGNSVLDIVHKKTNGIVVNIAPKALFAIRNPS